MDKKQSKPEESESRKYQPPVSLAPLSLDDAVDGLLQIDPSKIEKPDKPKKGAKKKPGDKK